MKIAVVVPSWPPGSMASGIVTYASQLVPALRRLGHEVFVLTAGKMDSDSYTVSLRDSAQNPTLWDRALFQLSPDFASYKAAVRPLIAAVKKLVADHQIDVFEMEETLGLNLAVSELNILPVVVRLHGPWFLTGRFNRNNVGKGRDIRRQVREGTGIRRADFVTAPSAAVLDSVRNHYGFELKASRVIPNAIEKDELAEVWDIHTSKPRTFLFVGRFDAAKGAGLVLRSFAELAAAYQDVKLTFVGADIGIAEADGKLLRFQEFLERHIPKDIHSQIDFRGQLPRADIAQLRRTHFATIIASQFESFAYVVLEAMSLGCPIIATAVGGTPEMIVDRRSGLLVPSQDVHAMAQACRSLLDDPALAARLGHQAWLDCRNAYNPDVIAKQTVAAYEEAIDAFKSRARSRRAIS